MGVTAQAGSGALRSRLAVGSICLAACFAATASFLLFVSKGDIAVQVRHARNCKTDPWGSQLVRGELTPIATDRALSDEDVFLATPEGKLEFVTSPGPNGRHEAGGGDDVVVRDPSVMIVLLALFDRVALSFLALSLWYLMPEPRQKLESERGVGLGTLVGALVSAIPPMCVLLVAGESVWDRYTYSYFAKAWYDGRPDWLPAVFVVNIVGSTWLASFAFAAKRLGVFDRLAAECEAGEQTKTEEGGHTVPTARGGG